MSLLIVARSAASFPLSIVSMARTSPGASSEIVVISAASGYTTSADTRSPPPNG
jgi:hypothetical protein